MRVTLDSAPQQAAIYINDKSYGIQGYTPFTAKLPKGTYTIILELPGFRPVSKPITVVRSQAFMFPLERQARPAVLDVRSVGNDSATGGQLFVDGSPVGAIPARVEVAAGSHLIEVKKPGFKDYRDQATLAEGDQRSMVIELQPEQKKGSILVTADVNGADVYVDGVRKDVAPALIPDLIEGDHTVEVRKDPLPAFRQVVRVIGNQQVKVEARIQAQVPQTGSLRVVTSAPAAEVVVDGENKGPANAEITGLKVGQHIVEVRAKGFAPQVMEVTVAAGEQRIAQVTLQPQATAQIAKLRIVTPVPEAEVFVDGASLGKAPVERNDLAPGKHYVVVRARGYAEWKREVILDPAAPVTLTADLSASGRVTVLANVDGADVLIDGELKGHTPLRNLENVPAGDHLAEVRMKGYYEAKTPFRLDGGESKILSADLKLISTGPAPAEVQRTYRTQTSWSAVTVEPNKFTADLYAGWFPFGGFNLTVGAFRKGMWGIDAGVEARTIGYMTEGLAHVRAQLLRAGPVALGARIAIGGGGGPDKKNDFVFELGIPFTLLFGDWVRMTIEPYVQAYSDQICPAKSDLAPDSPKQCQVGAVAPAGVKGYPGNNYNDRQGGARMMLRAALEIVVHQNVNFFLIFEGDPVGPRWLYSGYFSEALPLTDYQLYGRIGFTFKF
jgi:hypothetical protein